MTLVTVNLRVVSFKKFATKCPRLAVKNRECQLWESRGDALLKDGADFISKGGLGFFGGDGTRIERKLELVEKIGQLR
jgi:hypothetical protein